MPNVPADGFAHGDTVSGLPNGSAGKHGNRGYDRDSDGHRQHAAEHDDVCGSNPRRSPR